MKFHGIIFQHFKITKREHCLLNFDLQRFLILKRIWFPKLFFLFLKQNVLFITLRSSGALRAAGLGDDFFDKYLERLEKMQGIADGFNRTLFNSTSSFLLSLIFQELVVIV